MRITTYQRVESDYDLEHEITKEVQNIKFVIKGIDSNYNEDNLKAIKKALIETILDSL